MSGRPCTVCTSEQRSHIEDTIASGEALSAISASCALSRQSLRRHRDTHMGQPVEHLRDAGIGPYRVVLRMVETADRLHDLADQAEERGRLSDATRATVAESKALHQLLSIGVQGRQEIDHAGDYDALEQAVAALVRRTPVAGEIIAAELESRGRNSYASKLRGYADRCRALPEHQPVSTERLSLAQH